MRISEALHLTLQDVDLAGGVLSVRQSKFRKSRLVPVSAGTLETLRTYHDLRIAVAPADRPGPSSSPVAAPATAPRPSRRYSMTSLCRRGCGNPAAVVPGSMTCGRLSPSPGHDGVLIPGPQAHAMKLGFEKYFLWKARHGYVRS